MMVHFKIIIQVYAVRLPIINKSNLNLLDHVVPPSPLHENERRKESDILNRITIIRSGTVFLTLHLYIILHYLTVKKRSLNQEILDFKSKKGNIFISTKLIDHF